MTTTPPADPRANPMGGNPLRTRGDVRRAVLDLMEPVVAHLSPGGARARLGSYGSGFATRVTELEGWSRPLWGIVPLVVGGGSFPHWDRWVEGLAAGTDPDHPEYWGRCGDAVDQRMVEMAAIGNALAFVPELLWDPLTGVQRDRVITWLRGIETGEPAPNNWQFFRLLVQAGLERIGAPVDLAARRRSIDMIDSFHRSDGWYTDGDGGNVDYYNPFAFHTYGLILAASGLGDRAAAARWEERARQFAPAFAHWFAPDGAAIPFGRSLTYRFAQGSFWGALAMADVDALDWGIVKGLALRHLRWWSHRPISDRDGVLSVGYGYDNRVMSESYNSAGSPYWCMKAFLLLAAPDGHPVWADTEAEPAPPTTAVLPAAGMVLGRDHDQVIALVGQTGGWRFVEQAEAKYEKFAYSTRFGFAGEMTPRFSPAVTDSTIAITDTVTGHRTVRSSSVANDVADGVVLTRWEPLPGVVIHTALWGGAPWHIRLHHLETDRALTLTETGFALPAEPDDPGPAIDIERGPDHVTVRGEWGATTLADLPGDGTAPRTPELHRLPPNVHMLFPNAVVPALETTVERGTHFLACAVGAGADPTEVALRQAPTAPQDLRGRLVAFIQHTATDPA